MTRIEMIDPPIRAIVVEPFGEGWAVFCPGLGDAQLFRSGGVAERAARRLGQRLTWAGQPTAVHVRTRDESTDGRLALARPGLEPNAAGRAEKLGIIG